MNFHLRLPDFPSTVRQVLVMTFLANFGVLYPVYTLFLLSRDLNMTQVLSLESVLALFMVLCEVPSSLLADRWSRKNLVAAARLLDFISLLPMFWVRGFWPFAGLYALGGAAIAFQSGALEAYLYESLPDRSMMGRVLGWQRGAVYAGMLGGAATGSVLLAAFKEQGILLCLAAAAPAYGLAFVVSTRLPPDHPAAAAQGTGFRTILTTGLRQVFGSRRVLGMAVLALTVVGFSEKHYLWQPYLQSLGLSLGWFGVAAAAITLAGLGGSLLAGWSTGRWRPLVMVGTAGVLTAAALYGVISAPNLAWAVFPLVLLFLLAAWVEPVITTLLNEQFPDEARATALSSVSWLHSLVRMVLRPGIGRLADLNLRLPFGVDLVIVAASAAAAWVWAARMRPPGGRVNSHRESI